MKILALRRYAFTISVAAAAASLAGCGRSQPPIGALGAMPPLVLHRQTAPDGKRGGIYVSAQQSTRIFGYPKPNRLNGPPICSESVYPTGDVAVDGNGNLIAPVDFTEVLVFKGPRMCGPEVGSVQMCCEGHAVDAASSDAINGVIVVAALQDGSAGGSVEVCTLKNGCGTNLKNNHMNFVVGVALAKNGDCWASSQEGHYSGAVLTYFKGCSGSGTTATGYRNLEAGGLDIDEHGDLVAISSSSTPAIYVYSGCRPICKLVGGPFSLHGQVEFGHLNRYSTRFAAADYADGEIDIYKYAPTAVTFLYSFNNGLSPNANVSGAAYNPRAKQ